ncbi:MAG TPA: helix-turn-helix domain-containing protein [Jatrophihabitans sp.]|nr:helix-turn-helix domain-containing protein [Jatrophihabitans sp.]
MARTAVTADAETASTETASAEPATARPLRADAQRNRELLLAAARDAFTERGTSASLEDIARRAGVGVGTLYRHFPTRQALIEAVYVGEVEALCRSAAEHDDLGPWDALVLWFDRLVEYMATKRALADEVVATIGMDAPVLRQCHDAIFLVGEPLLRRAQEAGQVRPDVEFRDTIRLVGGVTMMKNAEPDEVRRVLALALDGLRYRA